MNIADILEAIVSELENTDIEVDATCPVCRGEGATDCPKCHGTGELAEPTLTEDELQEVSAAVSAAMQQLPPT